MIFTDHFPQKSRKLMADLWEATFTFRHFMGFRHLVVCVCVSIFGDQRVLIPLFPHGFF